MKKALILIIFLIATMTANGCSKALSEKEPVIIADTLSEADKAISSTGNSDVTIENGVAKQIKTSTGDDTVETGDKTEDSDTATDEVSSLEETSAPSEEASAPSDDATVSEPSKETEETRKLTIMIEGMEEEINGVVYHSDLGYQITYDKDLFQLSRPIEYMDNFMAENPNPELYPYVSFNIRRMDKEIGSDTPNWILTKQGSVSGYITPDLFDEVQFGSYEAKYYHSVSGTEWNSTVYNYYVIEHGDYYYFIETQYFLEAEEGYGARISAMLDTFTFE